MSRFSLKIVTLLEAPTSGLTKRLAILWSRLRCRPWRLGLRGLLVRGLLVCRLSPRCASTLVATALVVPCAAALGLRVSRGSGGKGGQVVIMAPDTYSLQEVRLGEVVGEQQVVEGKMAKFVRELAVYGFLDGAEVCISFYEEKVVSFSGRYLRGVCPRVSDRVYKVQGHRKLGTNCLRRQVWVLR